MQLICAPGAITKKRRPCLCYGLCIRLYQLEASGNERVRLIRGKALVDREFEMRQEFSERPSDEVDRYAICVPDVVEFVPHLVHLMWMHSDPRLFFVPAATLVAGEYKGVALDSRLGKKILYPVATVRDVLV